MIQMTSSRSLLPRGTHDLVYAAFCWFVRLDYVTPAQPAPVSSLVLLPRGVHVCIYTRALMDGFAINIIIDFVS